MHVIHLNQEIEQMISIFQFSKFPFASIRICVNLLFIQFWPSKSIFNHMLNVKLKICCYTLFNHFNIKAMKNMKMDFFFLLAILKMGKSDFHRQFGNVPTKLSCQCASVTLPSFQYSTDFIHSFVCICDYLTFSIRFFSSPLSFFLRYAK